MVQKIENVRMKTAIASIALDFFNSPGGLGKLSAVKILLHSKTFSMEKTTRNNIGDVNRRRKSFQVNNISFERRSVGTLSGLGRSGKNKRANAEFMNPMKREHSRDARRGRGAPRGRGRDMHI